MSTDSYPILVNPNSVPPKKPKITFVKLFLALILVLIASAGSWYLIQNKPWQKKVILEDPTVEKQAALAHAAIWSGLFELDTTAKRAALKNNPQISRGDLFAPTITEKPKLEEGSWVFEVVLEDNRGSIIYRTYRTMPILAQENNPTKWDFTVSVPYTPDAVLRILDSDGNQLFAEKT